MPITVPMILGAGKVAGSIFDSLQRTKNVKDQMKHNREMADLQHQRDVEMWQRANKYNEPSAQMARLRAAGLNEAMMYGNKGAGGMTQAQMPKYQSISTDFAQRSSPLAALQTLGAFQDYRLKAETTDKVRAQRDAIDVQNGISRLNAKMKQAETDYMLGPPSDKWDPETATFQKRKGKYVNWMLDAQLDALLEQNRLRQLSMEQSKQRTKGQLLSNKLTKLELDMWQAIGGQYGKAGKTFLPFLLRLFGK